MDLTALTAEQLDAHRVKVLNEQERRARLAGIPDQVAALATAYRDAGGDAADLAPRLEPTPPVEPDTSSDVVDEG